MCLGVYGRVVEAGADIATVDLGGGIVKEVMVGVEQLSEGDYVVVHAGVIVSKLSREEFLHVLKHIEDSAETLSGAGTLPAEWLESIRGRVKALSLLLERSGD